MEKQVLINYLVKPERVDENVALIKEVFKQLKTAKLTGVKYAAFKMGENVFVHVAQFASEAANKAFSELEAFKAFQKDGATRRLESPIINEIEEIGSFSSVDTK